LVFLLKTSTGACCVASKTSQWKTDVSVTRPSVVSLIHRQKTTSSFMVDDLILAFFSRSKIWRVRDCARRAMI